jgi:hypothetical protein
VSKNNRFDGDAGKRPNKRIRATETDVGDADSPNQTLLNQNISHA